MLNTSYEKCLWYYMGNVRGDFIMRGLCRLTNEICKHESCQILIIGIYVNKHTDILHNLATEMGNSMQAMIEFIDVTDAFIREIRTKMNEIIDELDKDGD